MKVQNRIETELKYAIKSVNHLNRTIANLESEEESDTDEIEFFKYELDQANKRLTRVKAFAELNPATSDEEE